MRVLLVEDSRRQRFYLKEALRRERFAIDTASDGEEGLWLAESNQYDVIILDIMLPKIDGLSVLKQLREKGCDTHILLLTNLGQSEDVEKGRELGADDYFIKANHTPAEIVEKVKYMLTKQLQK